MSLQFMEGFETAITGSDYAARGVLRLSTFEINAQPQGRNNGYALGRFGDSNGSNTSPRSTVSSTDPYVVKVSNKTINQLWSTGGVVISLWSQYKSAITTLGLVKKTGGGVYYGTIDATYQTSGSGSYTLSLESPGTPASGATGRPLRYSNGKFFQADFSTGTGYMRNIGSTTTVTLPKVFGTGSGAGITCIEYTGSLYVASGKQSTGTTQYIATSTDALTWTVRGPSGSGSNYPSLVKWLPGPNVFIAVGNGGQLLRSTDGITWTQPTNPGGTAVLYDIETDGVNIVVVGANVLLQSADAGATWTLRTNPISGVTWSSVASNTTHFVIGNATDGRTAYSIDGGLSWTIGGTGLAATKQNNMAFDGNNFVKANDSNIEYSTDNGLTWRTALRYIDTLTGPGPTISSNAGYWLIPGTGQSNGTITVPDGNNGYTTLVWGGSTWYYFIGSAINSGISTPNKNVWFNVKFILTPTTNTNQFTVTALVDNVQIYSSVRTWSGTQNLWFALPNTGINFHDDLVVTDYTGTTNVGDLGDVHIVAKFPSSDAQVQWDRVPDTLPSNAAAVNSGALSLSTSHVEAETSGTEDRYNSTLVGDISGLRAIAIQTEAHFSRLTTIETPTINLGTTLGSSTIRTPNIQITSAVGSVTYVSQINETDPSGNVWTNTNMENAGVSIEKV